MSSRIFIVEREPKSRMRLTTLIAGAPDLQLCGEADEECAAFDAITRLTPDLVLVEPLLNPSSPFELIRGLHALDGRMRILAISGGDEGNYALPALRAGARGFVCKSNEDISILTAVRRIDLGLLHFSPQVEQQVLESMVFGDVQRGWAVNGLSARELEVGTLIGAGATREEISIQLNIAESTVRTHQRHLMNKLRLPSYSRLRQFWLGWVAEAPERTRAATSSTGHASAAAIRNGINGGRGHRRRGDPPCNAWNLPHHARWSVTREPEGSRPLRPAEKDARETATDSLSPRHDTSA